ncbi:hypothetical protein BC834DRAFT_157517 [Gloeopeniophorella convolvens]|nr:hypothetical protein BC834DRAFT_157517 [Gloeopeniophorella convolvens]
MRKVRPTKLKGTVKKWLTRAWILNRRPRPARSLSAHPNASSIAAQLPTELLRMIFLHCVDNPRFATRSHVSPLIGSPSLMFVDVGALSHSISRSCGLP